MLHTCVHEVFILGSFDVGDDSITHISNSSGDSHSSSFFKHEVFQVRTLKMHIAYSHKGMEITLSGAAIIIIARNLYCASKFRSKLRGENYYSK